MRRLQRAVVLVAVAVMCSACFYTQADGNITLDGGQPPIFITAHFTLHRNESQLFVSIWNHNCGEDITCFQNAMMPLAQQRNQPLAVDAFWDAAAGVDEQNALYGLVFTRPGGFPTSTAWEKRCLGWRVKAPPWGIWDQTTARFIQGSWYWVRPGSWACV